MSHGPFRGQCLCDAITYEVTSLGSATHSHCKTCQRASGAAFMTWVDAPKEKLRIVSGVPRERRSSEVAFGLSAPNAGRSSS